MEYNYEGIEIPTLKELTKQQFEAAHAIFFDKVQNTELMCAIFDAFDRPGSRNHNCLGCNFVEMTDQVSKFLYLCTLKPDLLHPQQSFAIYAMLLNVIWERMSDIFKIVSLSEDYVARYFQAFIRIRRWANFFKHPKAFAWMIHHPNYTFDESEDGKAFRDDKSYLVIDDEFVKKYYAKEGATGLQGQLAGKENSVVVIFPNLEELTLAICDNLQKFIDIVTQNPVYKEILNEKSTFTNYYDEVDETSEPAI